MIKKLPQLLLTVLLLNSVNFNCSKYVTKETKETLEKKFSKEVSFPDLKTSSQGIIKTKGLVGCFCAIGFFETKEGNFGFMSHYPPSQLNEHLIAIKTAKQSWLQMNNYNRGILIACKLDEKYIGKNDKGSYIKQYEEEFKYFVKTLSLYFKNVMVLCYKYDFNDSISFDVSNSYFKTTRDSINLNNLFSQ